MKYIKLITLSLCLVVLSVLVFAGVTNAQSFKSGNTVTVAANETVDGMLFAGGKLNGEVGDPIVDAVAKRDSLVEVREQLGLKREDVIAIGDGANDKLMIEEAGLGVAFRAKPALVDVADAELRHHALDALLWVQGVPRRDWFRR